MAVMRVQDPRIARQTKMVNVVQDGPSSVTYQTVQPPDPTSFSPSIVIQTPSPQAGICRTLRLHARGALTVAGTNLQLWKVASAVALRQNPLQSAMQSCNVQLNDLTLSLGSLYLMANQLANAGNSSESMKQSQSGAPSRPDTYADYSYDLGAQTIFEAFGDNVYSDCAVSGRTAQITGFTYNEANTQCVISYEIYENLIISPLEYTNGLSKSIYGIATMTVNINYANFHRMLSWAPIATLAVTSVTNAFTAQDISVSYCVPHDNSLIERPMKNTYDWCTVQYYSSTYGQAVAPGATFQASVNAVEFATIPSRIIVYVTASGTDLQNPALSIPEFCCPCQNVSVTFGTRAGLLSGANSFMLWDIYRTNGGRLAYPVWAGLAVNSSQVPESPTAPRSYVGGPLILDCAADLSLPENVSPGLAQRIQFALNGSFVNNTPVTWSNMRVVVIALTSGMINIANGASVAVQGNGLTLAEAARAPLAGIQETQKLVTARQVNGFGGGAPVAGSWFNDFTSGLSSALGTVASVAAPIANIARSFGGAPIGGNLVGGRRMTKAQLARY